MVKAFAVAVVAIAGCIAPAAVSAAEANRDATRGVERIDRTSARPHIKPSKRRSAGVPRSAEAEPWVGNRTDAAGNSYVYFRTGVDTPFGPGRVLR